MQSLSYATSLDEGDSMGEQGWERLTIIASRAFACALLLLDCVARFLLL